MNLEDPVSQACEDIAEWDKPICGFEISASRECSYETTCTEAPDHQGAHKSKRRLPDVDWRGHTRSALLRIKELETELAQLQVDFECVVEPTDCPTCGSCGETGCCGVVKCYALEQHQGAYDDLAKENTVQRLQLEKLSEAGDVLAVAALGVVRDGDGLEPLKKALARYLEVDLPTEPAMTAGLERIICAAIYVDTGKAEPARRSHTYPKTGLVFGAWRHGDCFTAMNAWSDLLPEEERVRLRETIAGRSQGFLTSRGRYVSREEAADIAREARQILPPSRRGTTELFSEDLY